MSRFRQREQAMIYLYQTILREAIDQAIDTDAFLELSDDYRKVITHIFQEKDELIELIQDELYEWEFDRLGYIEQSILLLACGEAIIMATPKQVIINEMVELTKQYGDQDDTYKLINATLDKVLDI